MSSMNDLISRVLLPNTVEDLKRRLDAGRVAGWYQANSNAKCPESEKSRLSTDKTDPSKEGHKTLNKDNNKNSDNAGNSAYVNSSCGENLSWDTLNKVVKDKVQCPDCGKVFFNEVKLPDNFLKIYSNSVANTDSQVNNSLQPTIKQLPSLPSTSEPPRYECYICDRVFSQKENYAKHLKKHLSTKTSSRNKCDQCNKSFSNQQALFNHFLDHKANTCVKCGKSFPDKWKYERHYKTHLHKCHLCEKLFVQKYYLKKHLASNHDVFDYEPDPKPSQQKGLNNLNNLKMIEGVKPETAEVSNALVLVKPEEPHFESNPSDMAIVPYVAKPVLPQYKNACHICTKSFKDKWKLKQHLVIHSGERNWACNFCTQKFYFKYGLSRHIKNVHLGKDQTSNLLSVLDINEAAKEDNLKQD